MFSLRVHGYLAIEERVSQAVESRKASSFKTKYLSWTYGSFAHFFLRLIQVLRTETARAADFSRQNNLLLPFQWLTFYT